MLMSTKDHSLDLSHTNQSLPFLLRGVRKEELYHSYACQRPKDQSDPGWEYRHFLMSLVKLATADIMDKAKIHTHTSRIRKQPAVLKLLCFLL